MSEPTTENAEFHRLVRRIVEAERVARDLRAVVDFCTAVASGDEPDHDEPDHPLVSAVRDMALVANGKVSEEMRCTQVVRRLLFVAPTVPCGTDNEEWARLLSDARAALNPR